MNKKALSERDICTKFITPAIEEAGWDIQKQIREEVTFTDGRIYVRGHLTACGKKKRADYILYHKTHIPVAIIEAKDNRHTVGAGMQQALDYANILDIPSVFSSNGDGFIFHDRTATGDMEKDLTLEQFPSPTELWSKYTKYTGIETPQQEIIASQDYFFDGSGTRINEEFGKRYFTILDFRNVTDLFSDPDFDGDPVRIKPVSQECHRKRRDE